MPYSIRFGQLNAAYRALKALKFNIHGALKVFAAQPLGTTWTEKKKKSIMSRVRKARGKRSMHDKVKPEKRQVLNDIVTTDEPNAELFNPIFEPTKVVPSDR